MCWLSELFKKKEEPRPDWVVQSREEVAEAELEAASTHYAWMIAIEEERMTPEEIAIGGNYERHEYWYQKHMEAAWYDSSEYCKKVGII